jgi:hypothetical protein
MLIRNVFSYLHLLFVHQCIATEDDSSVVNYQVFSPGRTTFTLVPSPIGKQAAGDSAKVADNDDDEQEDEVEDLAAKAVAYEENDTSLSNVIYHELKCLDTEYAVISHLQCMLTNRLTEVSKYLRKALVRYLDSMCDVDNTLSDILPNILMHMDKVCFMHHLLS